MKIESIGIVRTFIVGAPATVEAVALALAHVGVEGATLNRGIGLWKGEHEPNVTVRIAGIDSFKANAVAVELLVRFDQEAIYVEIDGHAALFSADDY